MNIPTTDEEEKERTNYFNKWWWWEPPPDCLPFEFCRDTSLHGLKYMYQPRRHLTERIFWFIAFLTGLVVTVFMIIGLWNKYRDNPIIVAFETFETTVDEIPFPAVTICNMNKVQKSKAKEFIEKLHKEFSTAGFDEAQKNVYLLHHVCNVSSGFSKVFNFSLSQGAINEKYLNNYTTNPENTDQLDIEQFLQAASPRCPEMLPLCIWHDKVQNCTKLFNPIETDFGKCCTFNMIPQSLLHRFRNDSRDTPDELKQWSRWNIDNDGILIREYHNVDENGKPRHFPKRQKKAGKSFGLSILLDPDLDEYFCTSSDSVGFRLATHLAIDVPHVADYGIAIAPNTEVFVNVKPEITMAEDTIKNFPLQKRRCYFPKEHSLTYYNYYTPSNCIDECIAEKTYDSCNCVRYYMPRDDNKTLCGPDKFACAEEIKKQYLVQGFKSRCGDCLRSCTEIQYSMETTSTTLLNSDENWQYENGSFARWRRNNVSIVHIFIGIPSTYARVRKQVYGLSDLMAQTGGIMGLCLGFSGLSLVELIYYFTLRPWWRRKWIDIFGTKIFDAVINAWSKSKNQSHNGAMIEPIKTGVHRKPNFQISNPRHLQNQSGTSHRHNHSIHFHGQNLLLSEINHSFARLRADGAGTRSIYRELGQLRPEYSNSISPSGTGEIEPSAQALFKEIAPYYNNVQNRPDESRLRQEYWNV